MKPILPPMSALIWRRALIGAAMATSLSLGGCAVYPAGGYTYDSGTVVTGAVIAPAAPPPPRVEVVGAAPFIGAVWLPGRWIWRDRWVWHEGYWGRPPHPRAYWAPGHWDERHGRWHWHDGHWR